MKEDLTPLDDDALAVLDRLRPIEEVPTAARNRVLHATLARIAMVPGGGGTGRGGGETASAPNPRGAASFVGTHPWLSLSAAMLLGGAMGATMQGARQSPVARERSPLQPVLEVPSSSAGVPLAPWTELAPPAVPFPSAAPATLPRSAAPAEPPGQELAAESAILDIARTAIARGEPDHALAAVARHASTFPRGMLREEREALAVKALVLAGRGEEARARALKFRAKYPASLFLPAIDSSLRSIP